MNGEDDLLRRFAALRTPAKDPADSETHPVISHLAAVDEQARKAAAENEDLSAIAEGRVPHGVCLLQRPERDDNGDLARRFAHLKGGEGVAEGDDGEMRDDEVEAFLASLSTMGSTSPDPPIVDKGTHKLYREAATAVKDAQPYLPKTTPDEEMEDVETEEEILARALAEAELERSPSPLPPAPASPPTPRHPSPPREPANDDDGGAMFPALPAHLPPPVDDDEDDEPTKAMMSRLLGLSGPSQQPGLRLPSPPKREVGKGWNLPEYDDTRDDDMESWCCICNKDATLVCLGCDGDAYCRECWTEGHENEEERKHRVKKLVWGRKKALGA